ncbi:MAG: tetratricopeptide repeat 21B [Trebouxia sp. A1-2]|nr:MAG: tetratricopeptide repeat 21B [Trebouxia sp. A1-2]
MDNQKFSLLVNFSLRQGHICRLQDICSQALAVRTNDHAVLFWRASPQVGLAAKAALIHASGVAEDHDKEVAVIQMAAELDVSLFHLSSTSLNSSTFVQSVCNSSNGLLTGGQDQSVAAPTSALSQLAMFLWHTGSQERARACAERALEQAPGDAASLSLLGWILIHHPHANTESSSIEPEDLEQAAGLLEQVLLKQPRHTEALLGKAQCLQLLGNPAAALELINAVIAQQPWFLSALVEKTNLLVSMHEWEQGMEVLGQLLQQEPDNIEALHLSGIHLLAREGNNAGAAKQLKALIQAVERQEPHNPALWLHLAQPFGRLAGQDSSILELSSALVWRACKAAPGGPQYAVEAGYQALLHGDVQGALAQYSRASHLHELDMEAMYGSIECDLLVGKVRDAASQLEFLKEVGSAGVGSLQAPDLLYLQGLLAWKQGRDLAQAATMLDQALHTRIEGLLEVAPGPSFFTRLNPSRVLGVVWLFLGALGGTPKAADEPASPLLTKCERLLQALLKHCPGMAQAHLLLAESHHLGGNSPVALRKVADVLHRAPDNISAHMLLTRIYLHQGNSSAAQEALDQAVGISFGIRESAAYASVKAQLLLAEGSSEEAERLLQAAMNMPGVKRQPTSQPRQKGISRWGAEPSVSERLAVYLLLAHTLTEVAKIPEATKVIEDAAREFQGGPEQALVTIAKSQLALKRGDVDTALALLRHCTNTTMHWPNRTIDRQSPHFLKALTATASIQLEHKRDPAAYVHCYSQLAEEHADYESYRLLGAAFMRIQEPEKAIKALEAALERQPKDGDLAAQIGAALMSTHQYRRALDYYHKAVRNSPANRPLQLHLARLLLRLKSWDSAEKVLRSILERPEEGPGSIEKQAANAKALSMLAQVYKGRGNQAEYETCLKQAQGIQGGVLESVRGDHPELVAAHKQAAAELQMELAHLYSSQHKTDQEQYSDALQQLEQLLQRQPGNYTALAQLLTLLRRVGRVEEGAAYLHTAQDHVSRAAGTAGLHYCQGLHQRHSSQHKAALKAFNLARKDSHWEAQATLQMVEMYLHPEIEVMWAQAEQGLGLDQQPLQANLEAVAAAQKLLDDVHVTDNFAVQHKHRESVPVLLALASGFMLKKQTPKARNQLKHIQKICYVADEADQYERAWLLLADIYIQSGKFDLAQDLCRKCIKHNASCGKAWERLGSILEREQAYKDAAEHYENAWKHEQQSSPAIGYKLAFNYLKASRFVDAVNVCHKVLKSHPTYPKMKQDILDKARANIRP